MCHGKIVESQVGKIELNLQVSQCYWDYLQCMLKAKGGKPPQVFLPQEVLRWSFSASLMFYRLGNISWR